MIPWIVIGCIVLLFVVLFTAHAHITVEMAEDVALTVRFLGIPIRILPKKSKTYKIKHYTLKKIRKREAKAAKKAAKAAEKQKQKQAAKNEKKAAAAKLTKEELRERKAQKKASRPALTDLIPLVCRTLGLFVSRFFGKIHIKVVRLHVRVGGSDAMQTAVVYGGVNQAVQYLVEFLRRTCRMDSLKNADILVEPDFLSGKVEYEFKLTVRVSLGNLLGALIKAGWKFLVGFIRIKPDPDHPKGAKPPKPPKPPKAPKPDPVPRPDAPEPRA